MKRTSKATKKKTVCQAGYALTVGLAEALKELVALHADRRHCGVPCL